MKKLIVLAGALALAACGGSNDAATDANADAPAEVATAAAPSSAGTYSGTNPDGTVATSTLNADGTFVDMSNGEVVRTGTWEDNIRGTCFVEEGVEGEQCYNMGAPGPDGMVSVTGPDGSTTTMHKDS